jgi:hypothetical protein
MTYFEGDPRYQIFRETESTLCLIMTPEEKNDQYWKFCLYCGRTAEEGSIKETCIVAATPELRDWYDLFGKSEGYGDDLDVCSPRNFLPLCSDGGGCHNSFINF